jgi:hypothetical protein
MKFTIDVETFEDGTVSTLFHVSKEFLGKDFTAMSQDEKTVVAFIDIVIAALEGEIADGMAEGSVQVHSTKGWSN